jgi:hypothetical protein
LAGRILRTRALVDTVACGAVVALEALTCRFRVGTGSGWDGVGDAPLPLRLLFIRLVTARLRPMTITLLTARCGSGDAGDRGSFRRLVPDGVPIGQRAGVLLTGEKWVCALLAFAAKVPE